MMKSAAVTIVAMTPEHIESFYRALDMVARERKYLSFLEAPPLDSTRAFVLAVMDKRDPQLVAIADDEVIGWCDIARHERPIHSHRGTLGMGIVPAYREQGLGLRLLAAALDEARRAGMVRIELAVHADNPRAIALYEKVGFVREGVQRDAICIDGRYCDVIIMAIVER